jgi:hypothetical protein
MEFRTSTLADAAWIAEPELRLNVQFVNVESPAIQRAPSMPVEFSMNVQFVNVWPVHMLATLPMKPV